MSYARRMARLSARIFGEVVRKTAPQYVNPSLESSPSPSELGGDWKLSDWVLVSLTSQTEPTTAWITFSIMLALI